MLEANFWQNKQKSKTIVKEKKLFEELINSYSETTHKLDELNELYQMAIQENNQEIQNEVYESIKELRKLVDDGKKEMGEGIVVVFASKDEKVGVAVGITNKLTQKFDAVEFVKISSEIIGGQGGGGRKDFAQAGGQDQSKINEAFEKIKSLI